MAEAALVSLADSFKKLETDLGKAISSMQTLETQKLENQEVEKAFTKLKDGQRIFKFMGPVLIQQERAEAEHTVKGRLDFIRKEMSHTETQIKGIQAKLEKTKSDILQFQSAQEKK